MKLVMKFGGTSVADAPKIRLVARLIKRLLTEHQVVVVVSAMANVTDGLLEAAGSAVAGKEPHVRRLLSQLRVRHLKAARNLIKDLTLRRKVSQQLTDLLNELEAVVEGVLRLRELTQHTQDRILSFGERLSAPLLAGALEGLRVKARTLTGGEAGITTDENFGEAQPLMNVTKMEVQSKLKSLLEGRVVPIVTGFIGLSQKGEVTTLGRGGSDYTATLLGACLEVDEVWMWSDVDGLMTADPKIIPQAGLIEELSYAEAMEMAVFGAKALHPRALEPVAEQGIPVRIRNTFRLHIEGTRISSHVNPRGDVVKAVALITDVGLINITGASMVGQPGTAAKVFDILGRSGVNILMISQSVSESSISLVVRRNMLQRAVNTLQISLLGRGPVKEVSSEPDVSAVAVVGAGMRSTPGVAARVFSAVAKRGINVKMIAQGSSELNISFVVKEGEGEAAVRAVHEEFKLGRKSK